MAQAQVKTAVNTSLNFTGVTTLIGGSGNETFTLGKGRNNLRY